MLVLSGCDNGDAPAAETEGCEAFGSQAVRDYCSGVTAGDVLDCGDFASAVEATRFVAAHDPGNVNRLEQSSTSRAYCSNVAVAPTSGPPAAGPPEAGPPASTPAVTPTGLPTPTPAPATYTVEEGDNPTLIAQQLGVPEAEVDGWVLDLLALNGVEAGALFVGRELLLPPFGGSALAGDAPATRTAAPAGPTSTPLPTNTPLPTSTPLPTDTPLPTSTPEPTSTPSPTATPIPPARFSIDQAATTAGATVNYSGANYTPNDTTQIALPGLYSEPGASTNEVGAFSGSFVLAGWVPPGTYTVTITDSHGRTDSDLLTVH
jgi:hypothetical protein